MSRVDRARDPTPLCRRRRSERPIRRLRCFRPERRRASIWSRLRRSETTTIEATCQPASAAGGFGLAPFAGLRSSRHEFVLGDHLADRLDVGARGFGGQVCQADTLGLAEFSFQRQHQRQISPHPRVGFRAPGRLSQRLLGLGQLLRQRQRQPHVGEHAWLTRRDLQRVTIELHRARVIAQPIGDCALHRHDVPSRSVGRIGARQHVLGLRQLACVGQRLSIFSEHIEILRGFDRRRLDDRDRLAVAGERPQRPSIFDRGDLLAGIALVAPAAIVGVGAQLRFVSRHGRRSADRAGNVVEVLAAGEQGRAGGGAYQHAQRDRKAW